MQQLTPKLGEDKWAFHSELSEKHKWHSFHVQPLGPPVQQSYSMTESTFIYLNKETINQKLSTFLKK